MAATARRAAPGLTLAEDQRAMLKAAQELEAEAAELEAQAAALDGRKPQ
jgi:hypothetical protein